ncbi:hypothetical protein C8A05DRAFT_46661 [Staphylotrichum tortipilum]|uniref:Uncharacterized protein n=1 Tax=Staphylotrichum tortipilum TaxID=2831512 RepID=A0AAN6RQG1_9PEZI|nr:hypothetical protein C8A05DRAFT_46661 [Staphylotrichum longicolle]
MSPPSDHSAPGSPSSRLAAAIAKLKAMARRAHVARVPYDDDESEQYRTFRRAISNVLSTELALSTFAQIVDGLPTADIAFDRRFHGLDNDHPVDEHEELCPGVMEWTREIRDQFNPSILMFDPTLIKAYRRAIPGSRVFKVRFLELVAVSVHQLAALLFNLGVYMHTGGPEDVERVTQYQGPPLAPGLAVCIPEVTLFNHHGYLDDDIYPEGAADVAGYWAEDPEERAPIDPPNAWFNSSRRMVTNRYYQLLDHLQDAMVDFFLAEDPARVPCPLPVLGDKSNGVRVDFWDAILHRFICRDPWECKPPSEATVEFWARRPQNELDYPEHRAVLDAVTARFGDGLGMSPNEKEGGSHVEVPSQGGSKLPGNE